MNAVLEQQLKDELSSSYHDFEKGMNIYAYFKVSNHALGEDLVQDAFLKTWQYLHRGGRIDFMKAFLYHVLNNLIVDEYRKHKATSLDLLREKGFEPSIDLSERLFNYLDGKVARQLIQRLPEKYQEILCMRYMENLSLQEISLMTGQSKNTLAVQTSRGLNKLKDLYNHP